MKRIRQARAWPPAALATAATFAVAAAVLLAAACSSSPSPASAGGSPNAGNSTSSSNAGGPANSPSTNAQQALAFSRCMRAHGVPHFPDPTSKGRVPKFSAQTLGVSSSRLQTAENACINLLPGGVNGQFPQAELPVIMHGMLRFSQCMRSHGVPKWPDPTVNSMGNPVFVLIGIPGLDQHDYPQYVHAAERQCQHLLPPQLEGNEPVEI